MNTVAKTQKWRLWSLAGLGSFWPSVIKHCSADPKGSSSGDIKVREQKHLDTVKWILHLCISLTLLFCFSKLPNIRYILLGTFLNHFNFLCPWATVIWSGAKAITGYDILFYLLVCIRMNFISFWSTCLSVFKMKYYVNSFYAAFKSTESFGVLWDY